MRRECRECFPCYRLQRKQLVSDPDMHHGTCVTHVPWCMSESLTRGGGETVPVIPGACATCNFTYLVRGPFNDTSRHIGDKNWIQQVLVGLSSSFPINYTCYHYTSVGKYCTLCVQTVEWCQLAWGTMETRFVYFLIVKWTLHSACFTSRAMIQIHILGARLMSFKKIKHISMSSLE